MAYQATFQRYEMKYLLTAAQKEQLMECMAPHMELDAYGRTTIRNLYFDTAKYRLVRRSLEKPVYKMCIRDSSRAGDWKKRSNPGDLSRSIISPKVTTRTC